MRVKKNEDENCLSEKINYQLQYFLQLDLDEEGVGDVSFLASLDLVPVESLVRQELFLAKNADSPSDRPRRRFRLFFQFSARNNNSESNFKYKKR